jgi:hypothetical protein
MPTGLPEGEVLVDVLSPEQTEYTTGADGAVTVTLPPVSGAILIPRAQVIQGL